MNPPQTPHYHPQVSRLFGTTTPRGTNYCRDWARPVSTNGKTPTFEQGGGGACSTGNFQPSTFQLLTISPSIFQLSTISYTSQTLQQGHYWPIGENNNCSTLTTHRSLQKRARYYESSLSIWLSVDPLSDKYPSLSPYLYCANNPVILVDPDGRKVKMANDVARKYVESYLAEHFGELNCFRVNRHNQLKVQNRKFKKAMATASADQKILMNGIKEAIEADEQVNVHVNSSKSNTTYDIISEYRTMEDEYGFPVSEPFKKSEVEYTNAGAVYAPRIKEGGEWLDYNILLNHELGNETKLTSTNGTTGESASAVFMHELLDEFLNFFIKKTVKADSPQSEQLYYQNAALRNIGKPDRNGDDH